jgi:hypothetical protein
MIGVAPCRTTVQLHLSVRPISGGDAAIHETDERLQQEIGQSESRRHAALHVLQFCRIHQKPAYYSRNAADHVWDLRD